MQGGADAGPRAWCRPGTSRRVALRSSQLCCLCVRASQADAGTLRAGVTGGRGRADAGTLAPTSQWPARSRGLRGERGRRHLSFSARADGEEPRELAGPRAPALAPARSSGGTGPSTAAFALVLRELCTRPRSPVSTSRAGTRVNVTTLLVCDLWPKTLSREAEGGCWPRRGVFVPPAAGSVPTVTRPLATPLC